MSHDDFILGYQSGRLGCTVSTLLTLRLFLFGRIRETRVVIRLIGWSLGLLLLIALTTIGFLSLPTLWTLLGTIMLLAVFRARVHPPSLRTDRVYCLNRDAFLPVCLSRTCFICFR
jgi:hypothetical protein